ncbi:MAG: glycosyltransferase N-terminal domain-containing protein [Bacteroidota bacterium]
MHFLYQLGIHAYAALVRVASLFHAKARLRVDGLDDIWAKMRRSAAASASVNSSPRPLAWFHCASLGEFEQARPVIEGFRVRYPHFRILLTFFSPSGYEVRKGWPGADHIFYLPDDTADNAEKLYHTFKPDIAFFVKYEFWYNYLRVLHAKGVPIISFSAIFRPGQIFFKPHGKFFADMLRNFTHFFVQNEESKKLLNSIGIQNLSISGDTRFDRVAAIAEYRKDLPLAARFKGNKPLLLIGSAWPEDTEFLMPILNRLSDKLNIIIAPHEIEQDYIDDLREQFKGNSTTWSAAQDGGTSGAGLLIIDNIGMLSTLYRYADYAWVGGAFGKGLHNILEAAVWGIPVFFGPKYNKFQEADDLVKLGGAFSCTNEQATEALLLAFLENTKHKEAAGKASAAYVQSKTGATHSVLDNCANYSLLLSLPQNNQNPVSFNG